MITIGNGTYHEIVYFTSNEQRHAARPGCRLTVIAGITTTTSIPASAAALVGGRSAASSGKT